MFSTIRVLHNTYSVPSHLIGRTVTVRVRSETVDLSHGATNLLTMADTFGDMALKAAKANLTHEAFLYELVQAECNQRDEHRIARLRRQSGLPLEKTFDLLELGRFPAPIRLQVERLRSGAFLAQAVNIVAAGKPGVGKSHLMAAIGHELVQRGLPRLVDINGQPGPAAPNRH